MENFEVIDSELRGILGDHYHDEPPRRAEASVTEDTAEDHAADVAVNLPRFMAVVKHVLIFGGLCALVFYWQKLGWMAPAAAVPSMCVCNLLLGWNVGRDFMK